MAQASALGPGTKATGRPLFNRGFLSLALTQFCGAANDYILKGVLTFAVAVDGIWKGSLGEGGQAYVAYSLAIPFLLFSGFAGQLADRFSKARMAFWVKVLEVGIAMAVLAGFCLQSVALCLVATLLLGTHSAFYGPAKYGMIPELVQDGELSRANGLINMLTNLAVVAGTVVAAVVYAHFAGEGGVPRLLWLPGAVVMGVALAGLAAVRMLPALPAQNPGLRLRWDVVSPYIAALREMSHTPVLRVVVGWSLFYLIASMVLLIISDYRDVLEISSVKASLLMAVLGISIAVGSALAGWISGHQIRPGLVPVGTVALTVIFVLLARAPRDFDIVAGYLAAMGLFCGFYVIPLQALLQKLSPEDARGRFMGTANAISFATTILGAAIFQVAKQRDVASQQIFYIAALFAAAGTAFYYFLLPPHLRENQ